MDNLVFLPEITEDSLPIKKVCLHWNKSDETVVKIDDVLMKVKTSDGKIYSVKAHRSGLFVRFWDKKDLEIENQNTRSLLISETPHIFIGAIFDSYEDYIRSFYKYMPDVNVDSFSKQKTISWVFVAEPIIRLSIPDVNIISYDSFGDLKLSNNNLYRLYRKDASLENESFRKNIEISYSFLGIRFSFEYIEGKSFIEFSYYPNKILLKKNDTISFLFKNGKISDFKLHNKPHKKSANSNIKHFKCQLYAEDIENLKTSRILKWRISFDDEQKTPIIEEIVPPKEKVKNPYSSLIEHYDVKGHLKHAKRIPILIQNYAMFYSKVLEKEVPDYIYPSKEQRAQNSDNSIVGFDWCYVYLMQDLSNNYYKIGLSKTPEYRERTLQSEKPTIRMICNKRLPSRKIAEAFERALHIAFADKRIRGEWFNLDKNDVAQIEESLK